MKDKHLKTRVLFPIGVKLVFIITVLLLASLGAVIFMVSALSTQDAQRTAEENNFTLNIRAGSQAESSLIAVRDAVLFYLEMLDRHSAFEEDIELKKVFFNHNDNIASIEVIKSGNISYFHNEQFLNSRDIDPDDVERYIVSNISVASDTLMLFNASPFFNISMLSAVFINRSTRGRGETVKVLFYPDVLSESFGTGTNTSFLINSSGSLLLHPDTSMVMEGANFSSLPIVQTMQREGDNNRQVSYVHEEVGYFGAYYRITGTDATVITVIPHGVVFEAVQDITRQNLFLAAAVMFITICFIWFFSKTISRPVRILAAAALKIEDGDFVINLKPQTRDELGLLNESFNKMSRALSVFGRFTNRDIAVRAMRGQIKPGGFTKHATIFFSDIRDFTEKSESFTKTFGDDAANRIVLWLNEYFSRMVPCVEKNGGVVDKFIGDAVMAHWGTASASGNLAEDAFNCVKAALMMRESLIEHNAQILKNSSVNPTIRIGCGINTGVVVAGQIGSEERMEYTVVGDPVNLASRVESLCKPFGADILITENTWHLTGDKFITEEMLPVTVKGKEEPVRVFAVINFKNAEGPQTLAQVRELLGIEVPDAAAMGEGEKKYNIPVQKQIQKQSSENETESRPITESGPIIKMISFGSSAWIKGPAGKPVPVNFVWNTSNFNSDIHVIVEIASDQDFNSIVESREVVDSISVSIQMKPGIYWWRVYPVYSGYTEPINQAFPSGVLAVDTHA